MLCKEPWCSLLPRKLLVSLMRKSVITDLPQLHSLCQVLPSFPRGSACHCICIIMSDIVSSYLAPSQCLYSREAGSCQHREEVMRSSTDQRSGACKALKGNVLCVRQENENKVRRYIGEDGSVGEGSRTPSGTTISDTAVAFGTETDGLPTQQK